MYSRTALRLHLRFAIIVGAVAVVALAASPASGGGATKASSTFSGNACTLVNAVALAYASIAAPCRRHTTVDTKGGPYKVIYAADWGSVGGGNFETEAGDHALAVTVITPAAGYLSLVQAE